MEKQRQLERPSGVRDGKPASRIAEPDGRERVSIKPVNFRTVTFDIVGIDPMVMNRMGKKGREGLRTVAVRSGQDDKSKRTKRAARDFDAEFRDAQHVSKEGWVGIAAMGIKNGMVTVCVIADFYKTRAKMLIFVEPDGYSEFATPLFKITKGTPRPYEDVGRVKLGDYFTLDVARRELRGEFRTAPRLYFWNSWLAR